MRIRARLKDGVETEGLPGAPRNGSWVNGEFDEEEQWVILSEIRDGKRFCSLMSLCNFDRFQIGSPRRKRKRRTLTLDQFLKAIYE